MKMCYDCKKLNVDEGWSGTDLTPGDSPAIECWAGHFGTTDALESRGALGRCLRMAASCQDFEAIKGRAQ